MGACLNRAPKISPYEQEPGLNIYRDEFEKLGLNVRIVKRGSVGEVRRKPLNPSRYGEVSSAVLVVRRVRSFASPTAPSLRALSLCLSLSLSSISLPFPFYPFHMRLHASVSLSGGRNPLPLPHLPANRP